jgi:hypothetical protein
MSEYINGWDMQDAISRCADLEAELARERRDHAKLVEAARTMLDRYDNPPVTLHGLDHEPTLGERIEELRAALEAEVDDE